MCFPDRYVDCSSLKRALEAFYATLLAKGSYPFVYLSLEIDPTKIDVNVHPTKKEVAFEDEDEVVQLVCEKLAEVLEKQGESRSYKVQVRSTGLARFSFKPADEARPTDSLAYEWDAHGCSYAVQLVRRCDSRRLDLSQTLDFVLVETDQDCAEQTRTDRCSVADASRHVPDLAGSFDFAGSRRKDTRSGVCRGRGRRRPTEQEAQIGS